MDSIEAVTARLNPGLRLSGILLTLADQRTAHTRQIVDLTRTNFAGQVRVFDTLIRMNVRLKEAPITGASILAYDPRGEAAEAYRRLAGEVEESREVAHVG